SSFTFFGITHTRTVFSSSRATVIITVRPASNGINSTNILSPFVFYFTSHTEQTTSPGPATSTVSVLAWRWIRLYSANRSRSPLSWVDLWRGYSTNIKGALANAVDVPEH